MLKENRGTIVTVSSVLGHLGAANLSAYTASKAALLALHQSLRAELIQHPEIKTILVQPGQMGTNMFAGVATPSNFLAPIVTPAEIGKDIIRMIEKGDSGEICLPLYSKYIQILGVLPVGVQYLVRRWSGMDKAVGRIDPVKKDVKEKR
jgi:short-subunit dehydrogenase